MTKYRLMNNTASTMFNLAEAMYTEYCEAVGGKSYDGKPLPTAKEFFDDDSKAKQAMAWVKAAGKAIDYLRGFEDDKNLTFSEALQAMEVGYSVRLPKWSPEVRISIQHPDEHSKMTAPYLYVESRYGRVPWNPTQIELLAQNWEVYKAN